MTEAEDIRVEIADWAGKNMDIVKRVGVYPLWEKMWCMQTQHMNLRLRLFGHDVGADILVASCPGGYGADEDAWRGVNLGVARSVAQIEEMYRWLENMASAED